MLITLGYSVLTFIQSKLRREINGWIQKFSFGEQASLVFIRTFPDDENYNEFGKSLNSYSSIDNFALLTPSKSLKTKSDNSSQEQRQQYYENDKEKETEVTTEDSNKKRKQISHLCYNHQGVRIKRLLWEEEYVQTIALFPYQIVNLHSWTAFFGTKIDSSEIGITYCEWHKLYILLEAEPGATIRDQYRKFSQFGKITAWKCTSELALILYSEVKQIVELMHIFRLGQIILDGGWRVYRLTTIKCEGSIGTLIKQADFSIDSTNYLTPGDLRRISAGIYDKNSGTDTPKSCLSTENSKHDITTISEETLNEVDRIEDEANIKKLQNFYERTPKKKSLIPLPLEKPSSVYRKRLGSLGSFTNQQKSNSFASLLLCTKSISIEEEDLEGGNLKLTRKRIPSIRQSSLESLTSPTIVNKNMAQFKATTPTSAAGYNISSLATPIKSGVSGKKGSSNVRIGKPPNILVLCENSKLRHEIADILKKMLANDRYTIYEIRWDQLIIQGWAEQTALLVVSGKILDPLHHSTLLQFLGDGGRLLAWCSESHPFGIGQSEDNKFSEHKEIYYKDNLHTRALKISKNVWKKSSTKEDVPQDFPRIIETNDSEGYSRPLTASIFAKVKESNEAPILALSGGSLGGKAILSQVHFEEHTDDESCLALLSHILSQNLDIDCSKIIAPEHTPAFILGDHLRVMDFIKSTPSTVQQAELTLEFIPRGEKGSKPSFSKLPIYTLQCPENFSTLKYFENLKSNELGRVLIYSDVMTSTMFVLKGNPLKHGLTVIARQQTRGKGRGNNVWLSPIGSACFSVQLNINLDSQMGRRISLFQHLAALSVILAVPNHKEINLCVKWPNDIYLNQEKVGGILVESRIESKTAIINLGVGVNVSNENPTISLNTVLNEENKLSVESLIAKTLSKLEELLEEIENPSNLDKILNLYKENWIHNYEEGDFVRVEISEGKFSECEISGIDEFGFLRVTESSTGHVFSVRPDGNSFDIRNRLVAIKN